MPPVHDAQQVLESRTERPETRGFEQQARSSRSGDPNTIHVRPGAWFVENDGAGVRCSGMRYFLTMTVSLVLATDRSSSPRIGLFGTDMPVGLSYVQDSRPVLSTWLDLHRSCP